MCAYSGHSAFTTKFRNRTKHQDLHLSMFPYDQDRGKWSTFLQPIAETLDAYSHVILDNYAPHKQPKVRAWLARHPLWTFHFVPTSCSWLNAAEGFFAKPTRRRLKNGAFHSVVDLQATIDRFIKEHSQEPRPFIWKADPDEIVAAVRRAHQTLESIH
ncbi:transposase [Asticcacaulis benevestitus]